MNLLLSHTTFLALLLTICLRVRANTDEDDDLSLLKVYPLNYWRIFPENWDRRFDLGPYIVPARFQSISFDTNAEAKEHFARELRCSYAFSVIVHMYLTKAFFTTPTTLHRQHEWLFFSDEASYILTIAHDQHNKDDRGWQAIAKVMWIFLLYAKKAEDFIENHAKGTGSQRFELDPSMARQHDVVDRLFEDFIQTHSCRALDTTTRIPVLDVRSTILAQMDNDVSPTMLSAANKKRFSLQMKKNGTLGLIAQRQHRYTVGNLLKVEMEMDFGSLREAFGVQLDWDLVVKLLGGPYKQAKNFNKEIHERIEALLTVHGRFLDLLKAILVRIVVRHLLHIKHIMNTGAFKNRLLFMFHYLAGYNRAMTDHLRVFADYICLSDDQHLPPIMSMLMMPVWNFFGTEQIHQHVSDLMKSLVDISPDGAVFAKPVNVDDENSKLTMEAVDKVNDYYHIVTKVSDNTPYSIKESVWTAQVFVEFVKSCLTKGMDFNMLRSFGQIRESKTYKHLKSLEKNSSAK